MEDIKIFFTLTISEFLGYWDKITWNYFFCLRYRKEDFGFDIRIGLWQVNESRPFQLAF